MVKSKIVMLFVATLLVGVCLGSEEECGPCPPIPKHYEELGCKGHTVNGGCCPERFECPDLKSYAEDKCMFRGRAYDSGDSLAENIEADCSASCRCSEFSGKARFECAQIECPEFFAPQEPGCVGQHTLTTCCAPKTLCGDEAKTLPVCHLDGSKYVQGEMIYPKDAPCHKCVCDASWDNTTDVTANKNCRRLDCGIELRSLDRIRKGCVPVYFGEKSCCPIEYRCPDKSDELMPYEGRSEATDDPLLQCTYEAFKLQRGQQLKSNDRCVQCTCRNPPMIDCVRDPNC